MAGAPAPNFANRTMWMRDNLDVLRGLNSESVDLVYADPPFNSNKNYEAPIGSKAAGAAFKDTWTLSDVDLAWHSETAEREPKVYAAIDNAGIVHGKGMKSYLIMMAVQAARAAEGAEANRIAVPALRPHRRLIPANPGRRGFRSRRVLERHHLELPTVADEDPTVPEVALLDHNALGGANEEDRSLYHVAIAEIDTTTRAGGVAQDERVTGRIKFPTLRLYRELLTPSERRIIHVAGKSMEPTLPDGCSVLINREQRERRRGRVFVIRVREDELIVRGALEDPEAG